MCAEDPKLNVAMEKSGKIIGLRDHLVAGKTIYGPGDIGIIYEKAILTIIQKDTRELTINTTSLTLVERCHLKRPS